MSSRAILALMFVGAAGASLANDNADVEVYTDYPASPWEDWSWAPHVAQDTTYRHSYEHAIQVSFDPWSSLWFNNRAAPLNPSGYQYLQIWVNGGADSGQQFSVYLGSTDGDLPSVPSTNYATVVANRWKRLLIPLKDLGAPGHTINSVFIRNLTDKDVPTLWIDDVRFVKPVKSTATVTVDPSQALVKASPRSFGVNVAIWDGLFNQTGTEGLLKDGGFTFLRYPGGSLSDSYDWKTHSTADGTVWSWGPTTDQFLRTAQRVGAQRVITLNYGSGTVQQAVDWLTYTNLTLKKRVGYWCLGNECFGGWEYDTHAKQHDASTYVATFAQLLPAMKAVDPTAKVGVVATASEDDFEQDHAVVNPITGVEHKGWTAVLLNDLKTAGVVPDFVEFHYYPVWSGETDSNLLRRSKDWPGLYKAIRKMLVDYLGDSGRGVKIDITENNGNTGGKESTSLVNGLYLANSWAQSVLARFDGYMWWDFRNGTDLNGNYSPSLYGWRNWGDNGMVCSGPSGGVGDPANTPYPTFYAAKLIRRFLRPGERFVEATSSNELLAVYASRASDGHLRLMTINMARILWITSTLQVPAGSAGTKMVVAKYGKEQDWNRTDLLVSSQTIVGTPITMTFEPYSITVIDFGQ